MLMTVQAELFDHRLLLGLQLDQASLESSALLGRLARVVLTRHDFAFALAGLGCIAVATASTCASVNERELRHLEPDLRRVRLCIDLLQCCFSLHKQTCSGTR